MFKSIATVLTLTALAATPALAGMKRVTDEGAFRALMVGKTLKWERGTQITHANGQVQGTLNDGSGYHGVWSWQAGYYCRNLVFSGKETGTKCLTIEADGNHLRLTRDQGRGEAFMATVE